MFIEINRMIKMPQSGIKQVLYATPAWACFCQTPVLGLGLGVDFTFAWDNHNNHNNHNHNHNHNNHNHNNPHLNFVKGTVLGDKEQGVGIRDKG